MVAYLEKSDENAKFHQIMDFLSTCSINYALTVSPTIYASFIEQFWNTATSKTINLVKQIHVIVDGKAVVISESSMRNDFLFDDEDEPQTELLQTETPPTVSYKPQTEANIEQILPSPSIYQIKYKKTQKHRKAKKVIELPQTSIPLDLGADEAVHKEGVTVWNWLSLLMWQSQVPRNHGGAPTQTRSVRVLKQPNEPPLPEGHTSGSGEGRMEHTFEFMDIVPPTPHDLPLPGGYTPGSDEGRLKLEELMAMYEKKASKQGRTSDKKSSISHPRRRIYRQVESSDDDLDEEDASKQGRNSNKTKPMFKDNDFDMLDDTMEDVDATPVTPPTTTTVFDDDEYLTIAQTLVKMRSEKAKEKGVAFRDVEETPRLIRSITTLQHLPTIDPKDKGDAQIELDAEVALRLQVELDEEFRVEKERREEASKVAIAEMFDEVQARMDADYELAARITQEEQEKYTIEERARLLAEFFERRKKQLAAERAEAIRNKPPTKTQLRNLMMTYLKNMGGYKHSQLKGKSYEEIQGLYERQQKRIQDFTPMDSEKEAQKPGKRLKRVAGSYATQKSPKKPKVMKSAKDVTEEEAAEYEKEKEELRADGSLSYHRDTQAFLRRLDMQDLNDLYRLVQERFQDHPLEGHDLLLWGDLRMIFDPYEKDELWMNQLD
ncbi:hypothetical protein Tco_0201234 [Tanacetum coccineum]